MVTLALVVLVLAGQAEAQRVRGPVADTTLVQAERALAAGDVAQALRLATEHTKTNKTSARARLVAARAHMSRDELDLAYAQLRLALDASPRNVDVLYYLGRVTAQLSQRSFERLAKTAPDSARVHQLQAESLEAIEDTRGAEAEYQAALRAQPDLFDALLALARLKRLRPACDEAIPLYEKAEAIRPTFDTVYGLAVCHNALQHDEAAATFFAMAVRRNPTAAVAWAALGAAQHKLGRHAEAVVSLRKAIALEPAQGQAYYFLGMAYRALNDTVRAQEAFRKAEALGGAVGGAGRSTAPPAPNPPR